MRSSTVTEETKERTRNLWRAVAVGVSALAIATLSVGLSAQEADDLLGPFTPEEVATWEADRTFPTGGFDVCHCFRGRNDVARLGIDSANPSPVSAFYRTEGVQKADDIRRCRPGRSLPRSLLGKATQHGPVSGCSTRCSRGGSIAYGIIEFANVEAPVTGAPGTGWGPGSEPFEGFRIWDSEAPGTMVNLPNVDFTYGEWVTFRIEVDPNEPAYTGTSSMVSRSPPYQRGDSRRHHTGVAGELQLRGQHFRTPHHREL